MIAELLGRFVAAPALPDSVFERVRRYHIDTETFDRTLVHFMQDGTAYPLDARASNWHAHKRREQLSRGFEAHEWRQANRAYLGSAQYDRDMEAIPLRPDNWPEAEHERRCAARASQERRWQEHAAARKGQS